MVVVVIPVIVIVIVVPVVVEVPRPERRYADPPRIHAECRGEIVGDGGRSLASARFPHDGLAGQREPREVRARRRDDRVVQFRGCLPEQPRHRRRAQDGIAPVRIAQRLQALPGEQRDGDPLGRGEREQQQQRELAGEALRREPHPRSTAPANR